MPMVADDVQILFADLQPDLVPGSQTVPPDKLAAAAGDLAHVASIISLPVTFSVTSHGGKAASVVPELKNFANAANTFWRGPASPFLDPPTVAALASHGRRTLIIAGFSSEVVVLHAALSARADGYSVQLPLDAIGSMSERTEAAAIRQMEAAGCVTTAIWTLMSLIEPDFQQPPGKLVFDAMQPLRPGVG